MNGPIIILKTSKTFRLFVWSVRLLDEFQYRDGSTKELQPEAPKYETEGTNLCHLVRVLFLWMPAVFAWHLLAAAAALTAVAILPIQLFGVSSWLRGSLIIVAVCALLTMVVFVYHLRAVSIRTITPEKHSRYLLVEWIISKKQRVCPNVRWL